ncbi:MAG: Phenol hydroxylase P5 protein [Elusimicrobia bacterium]|nr:Phenol hydroxylase P5 protein [Elusimicrobiota bacterium]
MSQEHHARSFDTYETTVEEATLVTPRNIHLRFRLPDGKSIQFKSGQFVQVFVPQPDKPRRTSYSIASAPQNHEFIELCVTLVEGGKSSSYLHSLKPGNKVTFMGPLGKFIQPDPLPRDVVYIATGSGIAPFRSMIYDQLSKKTTKNMYLIFGNRFDDDTIYKSDWEKVASLHKNFTPLFTLSRPTEKWKGEKGYVQEKIQGFVPNLTDKDFYICGLSPMINAVQEKLISLGVPSSQIHFEKYD